MSQKTCMGNVDGRELIETSPLFVPISKRVDREKVEERYKTKQSPLARGRQRRRSCITPG